MTGLRPTTDGVVVIRPPEPGDAAILVAGRDDVFHRFLGPGAAEPQPAGCIVVNGEIVGWVDYDASRAWLRPGEVNLGYNVLAPHRGLGYGSRAVQLLMHHLAVDTGHEVATLLIHPENERSLALARRTRFTPCADLDGSRFFKRPVPPLTYADGVATIRRLRAEDLDRDLAAKDDEQIDGLWLPGQRETWEAMISDEQRAHALRGLESSRDAFGTGPKWAFAVDVPGADYAAYVDCDLANEHVPAGEANMSYSSHPEHRGRGRERAERANQWAQALRRRRRSLVLGPLDEGRSHTARVGGAPMSRAVRLVMRFLGDHTAARRCHLVVDADNAASQRVAASVGARPAERWVSGSGRRMIRYERSLD